jgi:hypothetical protein
MAAEVLRNERRGRMNADRDVSFMRPACYETRARMTSLQISKVGLGLARWGTARCAGPRRVQRREPFVHRLQVRLPFPKEHTLLPPAAARACLAAARQGLPSQLLQHGAIESC